MIMHPDEWDEEEYSWQKVDDQYTRLMGRNAFHDLRVSEYVSNETGKEVHVHITMHICFQFFFLCVVYDYIMCFASFCTHCFGIAS